MRNTHPDFSFEREVYGILTKSLSDDAGIQSVRGNVREDLRQLDSSLSPEPNHFEKLAERFHEFAGHSSKL